MTRLSERSLQLTSPPDDVDAVHGLMEQVWSDAPGIVAMDRFSFETALIELASNVLRHADDGSGITCTVTVEIGRGNIVARLADTGIAGEISLRPRDMPEEMSESGRGLAMIQALVDKVEHHREGGFNYWLISRRLRD